MLASVPIATGIPTLMPGGAFIAAVTMLVLVVMLGMSRRGKHSGNEDDARRRAGGSGSRGCRRDTAGHGSRRGGTERAGGVDGRSTNRRNGRAVAYGLSKCESGKAAEQQSYRDWSPKSPAQVDVAHRTLHAFFSVCEALAQSCQRMDTETASCVPFSQGAPHTQTQRARHAHPHQPISHAAAYVLLYLGGSET